MRPKFVLVILMVAVLAIGGAIWFKKSSAPASVPPAPVAEVAPTPASTPAPAPVIVKKAMTPDERQAVIEAEKDKLYAWSMANDAQSLSNILGDLTSPEQEIRMAAIEATKQFGDTNAIPVLKGMAANTTDNQEAIAMLQAADFIALPSVTFTKADPNQQLTPEQQQARDQARAKSQARRDAYLAAHGTGQDSFHGPHRPHGPGAGANPSTDPAPAPANPAAPAN